MIQRLFLDAGASLGAISQFLRVSPMVSGCESVTEHSFLFLVDLTVGYEMNVGHWE